MIASPRTRRLAAVALCGGGLVLPFSESAAQKGASPDSVMLRFGWPVGMSARVEQRWSRVRTGPQRGDSVGLRTSYRMRVLKHPEGRLVTADSFTFAPPSASAPTADRGAMAQRLQTQLAALTPSYVVSADGEFRRLVDAAKMKAVVDSLLAPILSEVKTLPPQAQQMLQAVASEQALTARAVEGWNVVTGAWVGADFTIGEVRRSESEERIPLIPGMTIPMAYEFSAVERVPCTEGGAARGCVRLRMYSQPDSAGMREVVKQLVAQLGGKADGVVATLEGMTVENEVVVVAEPATLVPHSMSVTKRVRVRTAATGGEAGSESTQVDVRTARFAYDR